MYKMRDIETTDSSCRKSVKAKFHYAILVADRSKAGRRPASSC